MSSPQAAALLAHVISQMQYNVDFLVSQNYISQSDASAIMSRLPTDAPVASIAAVTSYMSVFSPPVAPPVRRAAPAPTPRPQQARALWAYNEDGREPNDLAFSVGDIIEIVSEENEDWWKGRVNGREALFPSSYVEKMESAPVPQQRAIPPVSNKPAYRPFMAAHHGADAPPASGDGVNSLGLQQAPGQVERQNTTNKYTSTLATAAVGGVGFGAGSAIGGGLVRAIF